MDALQHLIRMRAVPVHSLASWTGSEPILRQVDERRNSFEYRFLVNLLQWRIALEAAREDIEVFEAERAENLLKLFFVRVAFNKEVLRVAATSGKPVVTSEDDPILGFGQTHNFVVVQNIRVHDVEAEDAQPSSQLAHHDIGDELDFNHSRFLHTAGNFNAHQVKGLRQSFAHQIDHEDIEQASGGVFFRYDPVPVVEEIESLSQRERVFRE